MKTNKVALTLILLISLLLGLVIAIAFLFVPNGIKYLIIGISLLIGILSVIHWLTLSKNIDDNLEKLSYTIQSLIDDRPKSTFTITEDNMLSKLQSQVIKLSQLLQGYHHKEKIEKERLTGLIADISHQLKTPLANLKMYNEFIKDPELDIENRLRFQKHIDDQLEKLDWLMLSLINMSRVETGCIQLNKSTQSIKQTMLQSINLSILNAEKKDIEIVLDEFEDIEIDHDSKWTSEALFNILDNAIKYSPSGASVRIRAICHELFLKIEILDQGIGIDEDDYTNIFKRFYRSPTVTNYEGIGIGLYLAQEIVVKQGGFIHVQSKMNEGSVFTVHMLI